MTNKSTNKHPKGGKPFAGKLRPHADLILELRRTMTWQEVANALKDRVGIQTTGAYVCEFVERYLRRPAPRGREVGGISVSTGKNGESVGTVTLNRKDPVSDAQRKRIEQLKTKPTVDAQEIDEADPWSRLGNFQASKPLTLDSNKQPNK